MNRDEKLTIALRGFVALGLEAQARRRGDTIPPELRDEARAAFRNTIVPRDFDRVEIPFPERGPPVHVKAQRGPRPEMSPLSET